MDEIDSCFELSCTGKYYSFILPIIKMQGFSGCSNYGRTSFYPHNTLTNDILTKQHTQQHINDCSFKLMPGINKTLYGKPVFAQPGHGRKIDLVLGLTRQHQAD